MSEKPKPGEWWEHKSGAKLYIVGNRSDGTTIVENDRGFVSSFCDFESWRHLRNCTGFDWTESFPQYLTWNGQRFADCAYIVRESRQVAFQVLTNGAVRKYDYPVDVPESWKIVAKEEALALLSPGCKQATPETTTSDTDVLAALVNLRDNLDRMDRRLQRLESLPARVLGSI